ncbi:hypothetical protein AYR62_15045 [Secundilactobacillus paracollinoides]|uniref:Pyridoxamine 5'-phosphate oxidase-like domain-containing protein n=1 Tax=Secundilactobacillus paracollinoides TaxID=240427 RepID=A0A1B2IW55_9LACO|nr:pyridoxamine 5'-phosphate oxidase family protein [Secundilactobacillus paracollinoides]ANZ60449.1 hypothetical protein AYR61_03225 [Secundilactobacillus paracollinoides]ANZ65265.1 hypothetical protein AYR62_15045 [Secundilactobacillus paracollinoides]ANZ66277.1 hypothetical protein AYR63_03430 [Secundilactobacillus paracollinoides]KRL77656.1 hypothetical protein FC17_GL001193 [Secundilactobacillus paracollinoides DSM 15502 = JCM 11969]
MQKTELTRILTAGGQVAVATLTEDATSPDVRIVIFSYMPDTHQLIFSTVSDSPKTAEITAHSTGAFTTIPAGNQDVVRAKNVTVKKVDATDEITSVYYDKYPFAKKMADNHSFYALEFTTAEVTADGETATVTF